MTIQRKYGRWLRVEVARHISAGTGEPSEVDDEVLNLDRIVRLYQGPRKKAVFEMQTGEHIFTTEPFEDACVRLMEAETPAITPPLSIRELQNRDLVASEECDPIFVEEKCLYCGELSGSMFHDGMVVQGHAFVSRGTAHR